MPRIMPFDSVEHLPKFAQDAVNAARKESDKLPLFIEHDGKTFILDRAKNLAGLHWLLWER